MRRLWVVLFSTARRISRNRPTPRVRLLWQRGEETGRKTHLSESAVCVCVNQTHLKIDISENIFKFLSIREYLIASLTDVSLHHDIASSQDDTETLCYIMLHHC